MCLIPTVRAATNADRPELIRMRHALFSNLADDVAAEVEPKAVFVTPRPNGGLSGYIEVGTRSAENGTSPVAFVAAWYVDPDVRRQGCGQALLRAAERWARARGCAITTAWTS